MLEIILKFRFIHSLCLGNPKAAANVCIDFHCKAEVQCNLIQKALN